MINRGDLVKTVGKPGLHWLFRLEPRFYRYAAVLNRDLTRSLFIYFFLILSFGSVSAASWENQQSAYSKTKTQISFAVTAKLINAFVFATRLVQFLLYLSPKVKASSMFLLLHRPVCVGPVRKPHCWLSHETAQF